MPYQLFPDEKAKKIVLEARQKTDSIEYEIFKLRQTGAYQLDLMKGTKFSQNDKARIKDWQKEISETKNEAKKEIDHLPLTSNEKQKYKDLIDGKTDKEKAEQKRFFEKDNYLTKGFNEKANSQPPSKDKDDLEW